MSNEQPIIKLKAKCKTSSDITICFWGTRGTVAASGKHTTLYGGNTACVEIECGQHHLILDGGTGMVPLGWKLNHQKKHINADIFLSHFHHDHICGIPFFTPFFKAENNFRVWAGVLPQYRSIKGLLAKVIRGPFCPFTPDAFLANIDYQEFKTGASFSPYPGLKVSTAPLNHPNRATGFRIEYNDKVICYITDTEHKVGSHDQNVINLCKNADIMIYDSMFTDAEFHNYVGWGHSTWEEACRLANASNVQNVILYHLQPSRTDDELNEIGRQALKMHPGALVAYEGMTIQF